MQGCVMRIIVLSYGLGILFGEASSDADRCISKGAGSIAVLKVQQCVSTNRDLKILCAPSERVVLKSLQVAVKSGREVCMKRVLGREHEFCCRVRNNDDLYNADCLQSLWSVEDQTHYDEFINEALEMCMDRSKCVLDSQLFSTLQRKIPGSVKYSSYFQLLHQCISAPVNLVNPCSSESVRANVIHIQDSFSGSNDNTLCMCQVTSQSGGSVIVKAIDVRTVDSVLILSSRTDVETFSRLPSPMFGFKEIFSSKGFNMSVRLSTVNRYDNLWLELSGSNGQDVNVVCGEQKHSTETTLKAASTSSSPHRTTTIQHERDESNLLEHWPLIYIAAGAVFTLVVVACIVTPIIICRCCRKKQKARRYRCTYAPDPSESHYATVSDVYPPIPDTTMGRHRVLDKRLDDASPRRGYPCIQDTGAYHISQDKTSEIPHDVSHLEAFLECK